MRIPKQRDYFWPDLGEVDPYREDETPYSFSVDIIYRDVREWYRHQSGPNFKTLAEASEYLVKQLDFMLPQGAALVWAIEPHYPLNEGPR